MTKNSLPTSTKISLKKTPTLKSSNQKIPATMRNLEYIFTSVRNRNESSSSKKTLMKKEVCSKRKNMKRLISLWLLNLG